MKAADIRAVAKVVVRTIRSHQTPIVQRLTDVEASFGQLRERMATLETKAVSAPPALDPDDVAASIAGMLRKELDDVQSAPRVTRRRIERDGTGFTVTEDAVR